MKTYICDICGCEMANPKMKIIRKYKIKKFWSLFNESGWDNMDVCYECYYDIIKMKKKRGLQNEKDNSST